MQVIGMIGYVDKYDFILNLSKTINLLGKNVLVIDGTFDKKMRYIVPNINIDEKYYITQFDGVDFAVGFDSMHDLENYTSEQKINISLYDYIIIDIDNPKSYEFFRTRGIDKMYFFIDTSLLSLGKNVEILKAMKVYNNSGEALKLTKVLYKSFLSRSSNQYFEEKISELEVNWNEESYEIPNEDQDVMANIDSQLSGIVDIKKHTRTFMENIADMTARILGDEFRAKDVIKQIKRRRD